MSNVICRIVKISDVRDRIEPLLAAHWGEVAKNKEAAPLNPCWIHYYENEMINRLVVVAAEDGTALVGYNVYFLGPMLHNAPKIMAQNDILYILPEYRRGSLAVRLIAMGEAEAKRLGADLINMHVKAGHDFSRLLLRAGYAEIETNYIKVVI